MLQAQKFLLTTTMNWNEMIVLMLPNNTYNNNNIYLSDGKEKQDDSFSSEGKVQIQEDIDFI